MRHKNIVIVTGGFDPIHSGHIDYINCARFLGDILVVGINSDAWLIRKKGKAFMSFEERCSVVYALKGVEYIIGFDDSDDTAKDCIKQVRSIYPDSHITFANGGDRTAKNIPEMSIQDDRLSFVFGVGGENKKNSSSWILKKWEEQSV